MKIRLRSGKLAGGLGPLLALCLILGLAVPALAVPPISHQFYGTVTIGEAPAPEGTIVSARIEGVDKEWTTTVDAFHRYGYNEMVGGTGTFKVDADDPQTPDLKEGGVPDDTVEFYITNEALGLDEVKANEPADFEIDGFSLLDLTVDVPDTTNPEVAIVDIADYVSVLAEISGTASDNVAVDKVEVSIENTTDSAFWNGTDWSSATEVWLDATGTEAWTYTMPALTSGKSYQVRAKAIDTSDNESTIASDSFTFDNIAPIATTSPEADVTGVAIDAPVTATFNEDVTLVDETGVSIVGSESGILLPDVSLDGAILTIGHDNFAAGEEVTVTIASGVVQDTASNLNAEISWGFSVFDPMVYDANEDGEIDKSEAIDAVWDYFNLQITKEQAIAVLWLYFG